MSTSGDALRGGSVDKRGESSDQGRPQPKAAEVESARLLANEARSLVDERCSDQELRRLADEYIALDLGEDLHAFVDWVDRSSTR
jgi:hypothetical protein